MEEKKKDNPGTSGTEWIGIAAIVILVIVVTLLIFFWLKPQLFSGSKYVPPGPPSTKVICPTSQAPTGLSLQVNDVSKPTFDASWNPVSSAFTTGQTILGYYVYVSASPGITTSNTTGVYVPITTVRVTTAGGTKLQFGNTYYVRVATMDTCGLGDVGSEEVSITI